MISAKTAGAEQSCGPEQAEQAEHGGGLRPKGLSGEKGTPLPELAGRQDRTCSVDAALFTSQFLISPDCFPNLTHHFTIFVLSAYPVIHW